MSDDHSCDHLLLKRFYDEGDLDALDELYRRHKAPCIAWMLRSIGKTAVQFYEAEGHFDEAFWSVVGKRSYDPERGSFGKYLYTVARNAFLTELRKKRPNVCYLSEFDNDHDHSNGNGGEASASLEAWVVDHHTPEPPDLVIDRERRQMIDDAINGIMKTLSDDEKALLRALWDSEAETDGELAERLGIDPGTVRTRRYRLLRRIGPELQDLNQDE